jgi:flavin reductase (DIM6/NTAB) family NADH-FMN oxidoreductase RutF
VKIQVPLNQALRMIVPGVVGLVTTEYRGRQNVATMSWLAPVSREPPLIAIAVHESTLSHDMIKRSGEFVVNVPNRDVINQVVTCGRFSGNDLDKFERTGLVMAEPTMVRAPLISQCIGHLECAVVNAYQPGDHTIFIGQIACAWAEEGAFDDGWRLEGNELKPLHHLGGALFGVLDERIDATPPELKVAT